MSEAEPIHSIESYLERRMRVTRELAGLDGQAVDFTPASSDPIIAKAELDAYNSNIDKLTIEGIILGLLVDDMNAGEDMLESLAKLTGGEFSDLQTAAILKTDFTAPAEQWTTEQTQTLDDIVGRIVEKTLNPAAHRATPA